MTSNSNTSLIRKYISSPDGNISVMTSVSALLLAVFVSVALDLTHLESSKNQLQDAVDSGALAAASEIRNGTANDNKADKVAREVVKANIVAHEVVAANLKVSEKHKCDSIKVTDQSVTLTCESHVKPMLIDVANQKKLNFSALAEVSLGGTGLTEVALVFDVSDSQETEGTLKSMEYALQDFIDADVFENLGGDVQLSLIPYANSVSFSSDYMKWISPSVDTSDFIGCFSHLSADISEPFDGGADLELWTDKSSCPDSSLNAEFFTPNKKAALDMVKNIDTAAMFATVQVTAERQFAAANGVGYLHGLVLRTLDHLPSRSFLRAR